MTAAPQLPTDLPPPGSSAQEVLFRRMLMQVAQRVSQQRYPAADAAAAAAAATPQPPPLKDWRTDAKFHCIMESLQEKLYDLEQAGPDVRPGPDVLAQYAAAVRAIACQLQPPALPSYCMRVDSSQDRLPAAAAAGQEAARGSSDGSSSHVKGKQQPNRSLHEQQQSQQPHHGSSAAHHPSTSTAAGRGSTATATTTSAAGAAGDAPNFSLSSRAQQQLTTQARLQDELTDELLEMGSELKSSTLAMQNAIRYRGKLLDETETHLVHSAENAKAVSAKAKEQYRQGNWNLCHTCIIVLSVFVIFTVMIVAIRVSSMVGLKGN